MSLSIVIPTYTINADLEKMAMDCIKSYKGQGEIIVVEDGGWYSDNLREMADTYIYNKQNIGFTANVNRGWRYATGDFVAIVSSDTYLVAGNLNDLCIKGKVTSPNIVNQVKPDLSGAFFCVPKEITKERGMLIEGMKIYWSDTEYEERTRDVFQKVDSVNIYHHQAQTVKAAGCEGHEQAEADKKVYDNLSKL